VRRFSLLLLFLAAQLSCSNAGSDLGFGVPITSGLDVNVFFDRDISGDYTPADTTIPGVKVRLFQAGAHVASDSDTTNVTGNVHFRGIAPGYYFVTVDSARLGDSLAIFRTPLIDTVRAGAIPVMQVGLSAPVVTIAQIRAAPPGQVYVVQALIEAGIDTYSDHAAYLHDSTGFLRVQHVTNLNGRSSNNRGDVVRVRGKVSAFNAEPVLDTTILYTGASHPAPLPLIVTTARAATGDGGAKDAALVRVVNALIADSINTGILIVGVNDGSGRAELHIDPAIVAPHSDFVLGAHIDVSGILVPTGTGTWQIWPRDPSDYTVH
jgi:hypothetical protein